MCVKFKNLLIPKYTYLYIKKWVQAAVEICGIKLYFKKG